MNKLVRLLLRWKLLAVLIVVAGFVIGRLLGRLIPAPIIIALFVFLFLIALFFYFFSDRILLRWYHAKELNDKNSPLYKITQRLAKNMGIQVPKVFIVHSAMPNAFSIGRNAHAGIVLTDALIDLLDDEEIEAVIAHEIVHVRNGDVFISTIVAVLSGILTAFATFAFWLSIFTGFGQEEDPAPNIIKFFFSSLLSPISAFFVQIFVHRSREFIADEQSVQIHGKTHKLISALEKIERELREHPHEINPAHAHLFIINPLHENEIELLDFHLPNYNALFQTHPKTQERIERLKRIGEKEERKEKEGKEKKEKKEIMIEEIEEKPKKRLKIRKHLFFSLLAYILVLFFIIVIDTFERKDFDFKRAAAISFIYLLALSFIFAVVWSVLRAKLNECSR